MFDASRKWNPETTALGLGTAFIVFAMVILVGDLVSQSVVGPWLVDDLDVREQPRWDERYGQLKVLGPGLPYSYRRWSDMSGTLPVLLESHEAFAACGMRDDELFGARVVADRKGMPWRVEELEAPEASRTCLEGVLATLPLEEELKGKWSAESIFKTDLATQRSRWEFEHPTPPFVFMHREKPGGGGILTNETTDKPAGGRLGEASALLTCPDRTSAVTRLDLRYEYGRLVHARTIPAVDCAEERAREHADELLALLYLPEGYGEIPRREPIAAADANWIEIAFELPLGAAL